MDQFESFWREADRRYGLAQVPRIRKGIVSAAASPFSYTVLFPGESEAAAAGVGRVSAVTPLVGDEVFIGLIQDEPIIFDVLNRGKINREASTPTGIAGTSSTTFISSGFATDVITQDLVAGQIVRVGIRSRLWCNPAGAGLAAVMSFKVTGASTYGPNDDDGIENDDSVSSTGFGSTLFTAANTGSHVFTLQFRAIGATTANFIQRRIQVLE